MAVTTAVQFDANADQNANGDQKKSIDDSSASSPVAIQNTSLRRILKLINSKQPIPIDLTSLSKDETNDEAINAILKALAENEHYNRIIVSNAQLFKPDFKKKFFNIIHKKTQIRVLFLINIIMDKEDMEGLQALPLTKLLIENSGITDEMAIILSKNRTLDFIHIFEGKFGDSGLVALAENPKLRTLQVFNNPDITLKGIIAILKANRIVELHIPHEIIIEETQIEELRKAFIENTSLERFDASPELMAKAQISFDERPSKSRFDSKVNYNGQKIVYSLSKKLYQKWNEDIKRLSGTALRKALEDLAFDPNGYNEDDNPWINDLLASELHGDVIKILKTFVGQIDLNKRDYEGKTALIIAAKMATPRKQYCASNLSTASVSSVIDRVPTAKTADEVLTTLLTLYRDHLDMNAQDYYGRTALHYLALYKKESLFLELIRAGALVNIMDEKGRTPLDYCSIGVAEQREILSSISLEPDRDIAACRDGLIEHISDYVGNSFSCFLSLGMKENLCIPTSMIASIQCLETLKSKILSNKDHVPPSTFEEDYLKIRRSFEGISIIDACNKPETVESMKKLIRSLGGLSFVDPALNINSILSNRLSLVIQEHSTLGKKQADLIINYLGDLESDDPTILNHFKVSKKPGNTETVEIFFDNDLSFTSHSLI